MNKLGKFEYIYLRLGVEIKPFWEFPQLLDAEASLWSVSYIPDGHDGHSGFLNFLCRSSCRG